MPSYPQRNYTLPLKPGTKVRTKYEHSELATVIKPSRRNLPKPGPDWFLIKYDLDGKKGYCHRDMLAISNQQVGAA